MAPVVVLVGAPGAGKTTVGALLAQEQGLAWVDTDEEIVRRAGKTVAEIFFDDGEEVFRRLEEEAVAAALTSAEGVLALGGGAVLSASTRARLAAHRVVWLRVGLPEAVARVGLGRDRPVLALQPRAMLRHLLEVRTPLYEEVATVVVETDRRSPSEVAAEVHRALAAEALP